FYVLDFLEKNGYLTEEISAIPLENSAYWNSLGMEAGSLLDKLREKPVSIETIGPLSTDIFLQTFGSTGINVNNKGVLKVIVTDDYKREEFKQINNEALGTGQPWMPIKPVGLELWVGPIFHPDETGCWECLQQRLEINSPMNMFYKTRGKTKRNLLLPGAYISPSMQIAAGMTAIEVIKWLYSGKNENLEGRLMTFDTDSFATGTHDLVKRPQCKACGDGNFKMNPEPVILRRDSGPCNSFPGGYREVSPETTLEKYRHHVDSITGVVQKLTPYHSIKGTPIYNYSSGLNTALRSKTLFWLNQHIRSGNGGKGKTRLQAKAGALCEAIERYSLVYHGEEPFISASLKQLGSDGIHPNDCMNYSQTQYRYRNESNQKCAKFYELVPVPFDESQEIHWTAVYSMNEKKFKYLPSCYCYAQYPAEDELNLFAYPDSNGCAAGNSLEEALLQGFLELVERDSVALWWYNMIPRPGVDLTGFNNPYYFKLIEYYKSLNRTLFVLDLTADLQIPTFAAVSYRKNIKPENIIFGFGAHVDATIAIERALIELNQLLPIVNGPKINPARGKYLTRDRNFSQWLNSAEIKAHPYLVPKKNVPLKTAGDYPILCKPNIYESITFCIERAAQQGLETLVLDLTRPDIGLPVVKVMVPGLRHFWRRLAPGRLYHVPIKMGWVEKKAKEVELNQIGLFI
ncbi:MAG: TOMM precursor leader peptide-binding protein, partial [bacterium]|nr:TOMM precursor leader peptide-binding protein [bacterium]